MLLRHLPPTRKSPLDDGIVNPFGHIQRLICSVLLHASKTSARGASKTRSSFSERSASDSSFFLSAMILLLFLFLLQFLQIDLKPVEALFPELPVILEIIDRLFHRFRLQPARPPLRLPPTRNQPATLQHLQVLRDRRQAHLERRRKLRDRNFSQRQPRQNRPARRIG